MGYFKRQNVKHGDATVKVILMCGTEAKEVLARVWMQPREPDVGIFEPYIDDFELLDPETEEPLDNLTEQLIEATEGRKGIEEKINEQLDDLDDGD